MDQCYSFIAGTLALICYPTWFCVSDVSKNKVTVYVTELNLLVLAYVSLLVSWAVFRDRNRCQVNCVEGFSSPDSS